MFDDVHWYDFAFCAYMIGMVPVFNSIEAIEKKYRVKFPLISWVVLMLIWPCVFVTSIIRFIKFKRGH